MHRNEVLRLLALHQEELGRMGVKSLALFGSVVRDEARPESDVDVLVEFGQPVGLFRFFEVQCRLEEIIGAKVDLVTRGAVIEELREEIYGEAVSVF